MPGDKIAKLSKAGQLRITYKNDLRAARVKQIRHKTRSKDDCIVLKLYLCFATAINNEIKHQVAQIKQNINASSDVIFFLTFSLFQVFQTKNHMVTAEIIACCNIFALYPQVS